MSRKATEPETDAERFARQQREVANYERANADTIVPGTARHDGRHAVGGITWNDQARMALARLPEHRNDVDLEALERVPQPTGYVGEHLR